MFRLPHLDYNLILYNYHYLDQVIHFTQSRLFQSLRDSYKAIVRIPVNRRHTDSYKTKEDTFLKSLEELFDISIKNLIHTGLITDDDRDFLLNHWQKTISSTPDIAAKKMVDKRLAREEKHSRYTEAQKEIAATTPRSSTRRSSIFPHSSTPPSSDNDTADTSQRSSGDEYRAAKVKRKRQGTTAHLTPDILKKVGPSADRLGMSSTQLTGIVASLCNHGGGNLDDITLSNSSAIRARDAARETKSAAIKGSFFCQPGQINFDAKLMKDLKGNLT